MPARKSTQPRERPLTKTLFALGALAICSGYADAQPAPTAAADAALKPPSPSVGASETEVRAWEGRYIDKGAFVEGGLDSKRVLFYDPRSLRKLPDGHVVGFFRAELFRPVVRYGQSIRSVRKTLELDCGGARTKDLAEEVFEASNLRGRSTRVAVPGTWGKPEPASSGPSQLRTNACRAADNAR